MKYAEKYYYPYHYADLISDESKYLMRLEEQNLLKIAIELLNLQKGESFLDAGCGDGRVIFELRKQIDPKTVSILGVDRNEEAIAFAKAFNPGISFQIQSLEKLKVKKKFDKILFMETIEHIPPKEIGKVLKDLQRLLKPNGTLIVTTPTINRPKTNDSHYQHFTRESITKELEPYFEIIELQGQSAIGKKRKRFTRKRMVGHLLFPLRHRFRFAKRYLENLKEYFDTHLSSCSVETGRRVIAICKLKKNT